ncbi:MAG: CsgG/HfaB family protein [Elusimicrobiota bacterium]
MYTSKGWSESSSVWSFTVSAEKPRETFRRKMPQKEEKANIAVADFTGKNVSAADASIVADFLRTELVGIGFYTVIEKANMDKILAEAAFQQTGCTESECAVQIGKLLNVKKMVVGNLSKLMDTFYITVNLVDVETGKIIASYDDEAATAIALKTIAKNLARRLVGLKISSQRVGYQQRQGIRQASQTKDGKLRKYRSPTAAFFWSFFLAGAGHFYNGQWGLGLAYSIIESGLTVAAIACLTTVEYEYYRYYDYYTKEYYYRYYSYCPYDDIGYILLAIDCGIHLIDMIHAPLAASAINAKYGLEPYSYQLNKNKDVALVLNPNFQKSSISLALEKKF